MVFGVKGCGSFGYIMEKGGGSRWVRNRMIRRVEEGMGKCDG